MAAFSAEDLRRIDQASPHESMQDRPDDKPPSALDFDALRSGERIRRHALAESLSNSNSQKATSPIVLIGLVRLIEFAILCLVGLAVRWAYLGLGVDFAHGLAIVSVAFMATIAFQAFKLNQVTVFRDPIFQGFRLLGALSLVFLSALALVFFLKADGVFSRVWLVSWWASAFTALMLERVFLGVIVRKLTAVGKLERRTVVVGGGPEGEQVLRDLTSQENSDIRICGVFDDRTNERSPDVVAGYPKLGNVDDLVEFARHTRIDLIIFTLPITAEARLLQMLRKLWVLPIDIRLSAHANKLRLRPRSYSWIGSVPVLDVFDKPIADWDVVVKSAFDKIVGFLCIVALSPVMLIVALAVKLTSPGPILFRQQRYGFNNEPIEVLKFRSMYVEQLDFTASKQVTRNDPRVTSLGRFIRRTSLDELPQLFNVVFQGNLSLVGPRPHAVHAKAADHAYDEVVDGYFARHRVRPGLTGWAQINGWRGETDTSEKIQKRVEHDLFYIENWSIWLDVYILLMTPIALIKGHNAY